MSKGFVKVFDNFLPSDLINQLEQVSLSEIKYHYMKNISSSNPTHFLPGFGIDLLNKDNNYIDWKDFPLYSQVLYQFCLQQKIRLFDIYRLRLNLTLPNNKDLSKIIHTDLNYPHWVLLYYINDTDGDTIFFNENNKEIKRVSPKKGRCVFFNGNVKHAGNYPTQNERIGININFIGKHE